MAVVSVAPVESKALHRPSSVSVIICVDGDQRSDRIVSGVASLESQTHPPRQVVVVIDHNDDLLERVADQLGGSESDMRIDVVANTLGQGLSGCRNTGVAWCDGDVIAFLDDEARTHDPYWLATMLENYADPDVAGVSGGITPAWDGVDAPGWFPQEFGWVIGCSYARLPTEVEDVLNFSGRNMSFRREVFEEIGGFCDGIARSAEKPAGYDEKEYCGRLRRRFPSARLVFDPDLEVFRRVSADRGDFRYFRLRCFGEGVSKALVARRVGSRDGTASGRTRNSERLPHGVLRGIADGVRGHVSGFQRAGAIVLGSLWTSAGYMRGRMSRSSMG